MIFCISQHSKRNWPTNDSVFLQLYSYLKSEKNWIVKASSISLQFYSNTNLSLKNHRLYSPCVFGHGCLRLNFHILFRKNIITGAFTHPVQLFVFCTALLFEITYVGSCMSMENGYTCIFWIVLHFQKAYLANYKQSKLFWNPLRFRKCSCSVLLKSKTESTFVNRIWQLSLNHLK